MLGWENMSNVTTLLCDALFLRSFNNSALDSFVHLAEGGFGEGYFSHV